MTERERFERLLKEDGHSTMKDADGGYLDVTTKHLFRYFTAALAAQEPVKASDDELIAFAAWCNDNLSWFLHESNADIVAAYRASQKGEDREQEASEM